MGIRNKLLTVAIRHHIHDRSDAIEHLPGCTVCAASAISFSAFALQRLFFCFPHIPAT
jgi:hypothetical protein